ncbi:YggU-like protein [Annulohypoxylon nitens]|nr:YggU-like protein [Annulohypoxylon nitens]
MAARNAITLVRKSKPSAPEFLQLRCHITPGASKVREGVAAVTDECIEICVSAQPQDGKSNKAVLELLSEVLDVPKSDLQIIHGMKNRDKTISIASACFRRGKNMDGSEDIVSLVRQKLLSQETS